MGAVGAIVVDSTVGTSAAKDRLFYMSGDLAETRQQRQQQQGKEEDRMELPMVFVYHQEGRALVDAMARRWRDSRRPLVAAIAKTHDNPSQQSRPASFVTQT